MALSDKKILQSERNAVYVKSNQGRRLTGTVEQNKDAFDKFPQLLMDKYNALIDLLTSLGLDSIATDLESRYTKTETDAKISTETNDLIETIQYTKADGKFKITTKGGTSTTIDTDLEKIPASFELIESDGKTYLRITNQDGSYTQTDVTSLLNVYTFNDSDTVDFTESTKYSVTAAVKPNSITIDHLSLAAVSTLEGYVSAAAGSATAAAGSATAAETSANNASAFNQSAKGYSESASASKDAAASSATSAGNAATTANQKATDASNSAILSQSYAKGGTGTRQGEDADNAKYYMEQAKLIAGGDYITKVSEPIANNIPTLTSEGQLQDSGKTVDDLIDVFLVTIGSSKLDPDAEPTYHADKTGTEIKTASDAGKTVICRYGPCDYYFGNMDIDDSNADEIITAIYFYSPFTEDFINTSVFILEVAHGETDDVWIKETIKGMPSPTLNINDQILTASDNRNIYWKKGPICVSLDDSGGTQTVDKTFDDIMAANSYGNEVLINYTPPDGVGYYMGRLEQVVIRTTEGNVNSYATFVCTNGERIKYTITCIYKGSDNADVWNVVDNSTHLMVANLSAGSTSLVFQDDSIKTNSTIDIYTDKWGVNPTDVTVETGKLTLTFDAQDSALAVKVEVK